MNPSRLLSKIVVKIATTKFPKFIQCFINKTYVKIFKIDMEKYEPENPCDYETLNDLFIRHKKYIEFYEDDDILVSPSDSEVIANGDIEDNYVYQIKGKKYKIDELIPYETKIDGGYFINLYLSPSDYHRFHVPIDMEIVKATYIPGTLMPVKPAQLEKELVFPKNKRVVLRCKDKKDRYFYFVAVGAMIVGKIHFNFDERLQKDYEEITTFEYKKPVKLKKGDELGRFEFGSSILLFFGPDHFKYLNQQDKVEVGDILGEIF
ncbi:phosphatidylserine decarboxylase [Nautilia profundicola AmH]|uniref:phosphatidylserine decarboxylase n=1 Tax=Nautilia profundicola (strain ATCC BAA-1463 / DSM 18972 / AmH) TaxID=598659 RepID=B9L7H4_NAUPA|nr:phosphatidylserine decarboxylase [Nautilia profundicola]ACM93501.1 phosphatidylserine decarboxylase [Nautilia profundicola AmH]